MWDVWIRTVKQKAKLSSLVQQKVMLRPQGGKWCGLCPFHQEKSPSFWVDDDKGFYHCFGCGAKGDVFNWLQHTQYMDFMDSARFLADYVHIPLPQKNNTDHGLNVDIRLQLQALEAAYVYYQDALQGLSDQHEAWIYLNSRGITRDIAKHFGLGWSGVDGPQNISCVQFLMQQGFSRAILIDVGLMKASGQDFFYQRIMFPVRPYKEVVAFGGRVMGDRMPKYLNSPDHPSFTKSACLYGVHESRLTLKRLNDLSQQNIAFVVLVEGYMDAICLQQHGIPRSFAILGTALQGYHLERCFRSAKEIHLCFDGDKAGIEAVQRSLPMIFTYLSCEKQVRIVRLTATTDDPESFVRTHGIEAFATLCRHAPTVFDVHMEGWKTCQTPESKASFMAQTQQLLQGVKDHFLRDTYSRQAHDIMHVSKENARNLDQTSYVGAKTPSIWVRQQSDRKGRGNRGSYGPHDQRALFDGSMNHRAAAHRSRRSDTMQDLKKYDYNDSTPLSLRLLFAVLWYFPHVIERVGEALQALELKRECAYIRKLFLSFDIKKYIFSQKASPECTSPKIDKTSRVIDDAPRPNITPIVINENVALHHHFGRQINLEEWREHLYNHIKLFEQTSLLSTLQRRSLRRLITLPDDASLDDVYAFWMDIYRSYQDQYHAHHKRKENVLLAAVSEKEWIKLRAQRMSHDDDT